jgi:hypothetical protein
MPPAMEQPIIKKYKLKKEGLLMKTPLYLGLFCENNVQLQWMGDRVVFTKGGRQQHDRIHPHGRWLRQEGHLRGGDLGLQEAPLRALGDPRYKAQVATPEICLIVYGHFVLMLVW